ncbi:MAG: hypothetical protein K2L16_05170 [Muribaculaceae bacterium]|nr:hypothetical protein [Muribaculaceae bacterium]
MPEHKKELRRGVPFYGFPIGTISKVKKIVLGLRYKVGAFPTGCQIFLYVIGHSFLAMPLVGARDTFFANCNTINYIRNSTSVAQVCVSVKNGKMLEEAWQSACQGLLRLRNCFKQFLNIPASSLSRVFRAEEP